MVFTRYTAGLTIQLTLKKKNKIGWVPSAPSSALARKERASQNLWQPPTFRNQGSYEVRILGAGRARRCGGNKK